VKIGLDFKTLEELPVRKLLGVRPGHNLVGVDAIGISRYLTDTPPGPTANLCPLRTMSTDGSPKAQAQRSRYHDRPPMTIQLRLSLSPFSLFGSYAETPTKLSLNPIVIEKAVYSENPST